MEPSSGGKPASFLVSLDPSGERFEARVDRTVLLSALDAGVILPSSCRNGTCRTCMQLLRSGRVAYRIEWPGLLREETEEGWILPCVAYPESDLVISAPAL